MIENKTVYKGQTVAIKLKNIQTEIVRFEKSSYSVWDLIRRMLKISQ